MAKKYARIEGGTAVEVFTPPDGFELGECFHPEVAALFVEVDAVVELDWTCNGGTWSPPAPPDVPVVPNDPPA